MSPLYRYSRVSGERRKTIDKRLTETLQLSAEISRVPEGKEASPSTHAEPMSPTKQSHLKANLGLWVVCSSFKQQHHKMNGMCLINFITLMSTHSQLVWGSFSQKETKRRKQVNEESRNIHSAWKGDMHSCLLSLPFSSLLGEAKVERTTVNANPFQNSMDTRY